MANRQYKALPKFTESQIADFWSKVDKTPGHGPQGECWLWTAGCTARGYGAFAPTGDINVAAHRVGYFLATGKDAEQCVLHSCDMPPCVRGEHLSDGTHKENAEQREARKRSKTGDQHWMRLFPERVKRGDENAARKHPERLARGDRNGAWTHPETRARGERNGSAKLSNVAVLEIRRRFNAGGCTRMALGKEFGVSNTVIGRIVANLTWTSVSSESVKL